MKSKIFKEEELNQKFEDQGFVKIPFWRQQEVALVKAYFEENFENKHNSNKKFHTTYETINKALVREVNAFLQPLFLKSTRELLAETDVVSSGFLIKEPGEGSDTPLHQDASFVNEDVHCSFSIWVPLQDCDSSNACLQFIPHSHKLFTATRSLPYTNKHIEVHREAILPFLTDLTIQAGEAFVFNNAVVHGSSINSSKVNRLAAVMGFHSRGSQLSLYVDGKNDVIKRYAISEEELIQINDDFNFDDKEALEIIKKPEAISEKDVKNFIKKEFSLLERGKAFFK